MRAIKALTPGFNKQTTQGTTVKYLLLCRILKKIYKKKKINRITNQEKLREAVKTRLRNRM